MGGCQGTVNTTEEMDSLGMNPVSGVRKQNCTLAKLRISSRHPHLFRWLLSKLHTIFLHPFLPCVHSLKKKDGCSTGSPMGFVHSFTGLKPGSQGELLLLSHLSGTKVISTVLAPLPHLGVLSFLSCSYLLPHLFLLSCLKPWN